LKGITLQHLRVQVRQATKEKIEANLLRQPDISISFNLTLSYSHTDESLIDVTCNKCGYIKEGYRVRSLSKKDYICQGCLVSRYKDLCEQVNRTYISYKKREGNRRTILSSCKSCGTNRETSSSDLLSGKGIKCDTCLTNRYTELSSALDFVYLGKEILQNGALSLDLMCKHNHKFKARLGNLQKGSVICKDCQNLSYSSELAKKDCTLFYVQLNEGGKRRIFYKNKCGDIFSTTSSNLYQGRFANSLDGPWRERHCTYLIQLFYNGTVYYKIGTAANAERRLKEIDLCGDAKVFVLMCFDTRFEADALESELHREFKVYRLDREVAKEFTRGEVRVRKKDSVAKVKIKHGTTEWFTHEVFDILKTRYNLNKE
jgi:Meiotically up-regulated gene 113